MDALRSAVLYRHKNAQLEELLDGNELVYDFGLLDRDHNWQYFEPEDYTLKTDAAKQLIDRLSSISPMLYYQHLDGCSYACDDDLEPMPDSEYRIYHNGKIIAEAQFSYTWPSWGEPLEKAVKKAVEHANTDKFALLEFDQQGLSKLKQLMDAETLFERLDNDDTLYDITAEFQKIVGIYDCFAR